MKDIRNIWSVASKRLAVGVLAPHEFAAKDIGLTSMKRLVGALGMVHTNQSKYWGKITANLEAVQMQSASMQRKIETLHSRMDQLVPRVGSAQGGRGLDDRNN